MFIVFVVIATILIIAIVRFAQANEKERVLNVEKRKLEDNIRSAEKSINQKGKR